MKKKTINNICDKKTFREIYDRFSNDIHDYLYYKFGSQYNPNDKTQEAFIKLWENCKKIEVGAAKAFLYKVASNLTLNEIKHAKVVLKHQKILPKHYENETPEFLMEKEQFLKRYEYALSQLTEEQRICFVLNKIEGKTHKEIGEMQGITKKVAEYRIYSAFQKIKEVIKEFNI